QERDARWSKYGALFTVAARSSAPEGCASKTFAGSSERRPRLTPSPPPCLLFSLSPRPARSPHSPLTLSPRHPLKTALAALYPHIPCTPPPGGVEAEQIQRPGTGVA